jgi:hypothetical protein
VNKPFHAVAPPEAIDCDLACPAVDLEREEVLPFCAADMQECDLSRLRAKSHKRVVLDRHIPKVRRHDALDRGEGPEEPAREIDEVDALIDELASAGLYRVGTPFLVVTDTTAVAISTPDEHQRTETLRVDNRSSLEKRWMIAMIEPDSHQPPMTLGGLRQCVQLLHTATSWLLDQYVLTRFHSRRRYRRQPIIRRRNDDNVDIRPAHRVLPSLDGCRSLDTPSHIASTFDHGIGADNQARPGERCSTFATDQAAADDRNTH